MALDSTASAHWEGDLTSGSGTTKLESSGAAGPLDISWKARTEEHGGLTSPEELLAAAHASCFSMAFSARLAKAGSAPESLDTTATATFVPGEGITGVVLNVKGVVPGMSQDDFKTIAEDAKENCPVSQALSVPITVEASLA